MDFILDVAEYFAPLMFLIVAIKRAIFGPQRKFASISLLSIVIAIPIYLAAIFTNSDLLYYLSAGLAFAGVFLILVMFSVDIWHNWFVVIFPAYSKNRKKS